MEKKGKTLQALTFL